MSDKLATPIELKKASIERVKAPRPKAWDELGNLVPVGLPTQGDKIYIWINEVGGLIAGASLHSISENIDTIECTLSDFEVLGPPFLSLEGGPNSRTVIRGKFREPSSGLIERFHKFRLRQTRELSDSDVCELEALLARLSGPPNSIDDVRAAEEDLKPLSATERESIIKARVGQGIFRERLVSYWKGCAVLGDIPSYCLRASHIKPWRESSNVERLDPFNGLLLSPNIDHLFDAGLIAFDGPTIVISRRIESSIAGRLSITPNLMLRKLEDSHLPYLRWHLLNCFIES